jgi:hypothetical protein
MNDVVASAPTPTISLPRGSWYLLEGVCQKPAPWTTTVLTTRAAKLWSKLHKANPAISGEYKFEKRIIKQEGESDSAFATRVDASGEAFDAWQRDPLSLPISAKEKATIEKGIAWALKNRDKTWPENNDLILAILTTFDASADDEEDTE